MTLSISVQKRYIGIASAESDRYHRCTIQQRNFVNQKEPRSQVLNKKFSCSNDANYKI